ncbi:plant intracellular Ras-group-related LRR protein 5-like [Macadamia integrifolia]|uniref:plant intracellular Ras-group-related LRR protein 5-like n=1 Tax=Macadamia integrifolia TaxID=60698 RepID=UPI001C4F50D3|nr:plant intracellular Ras-group-related LRR protein 5-like [Macadamia integrifolia]
MKWGGSLNQPEIDVSSVLSHCILGLNVIWGIFIGEGDIEKLSLMKVAGLIETSAKTGTEVLDLGGKLMEQVEWLPVSIGKLLVITELNLSENRIMALPSSFGGLKALTKLDIHSNQLINLPESFGELVNLTELDLHGNRLRSLPASFGNLTNLIVLDLSSNNLTVLPPTLGNLTHLKRLNVETNELEELPYTIGSCSSLVELRLDFNKLKALLEAIGKLECLEIHTLHYNRITGLQLKIMPIKRSLKIPIRSAYLGHLLESNHSLAGENDELTNVQKVHVDHEKDSLANKRNHQCLYKGHLANLERTYVVESCDNRFHTEILSDSFKSLKKSKESMLKLNQALGVLGDALKPTTVGLQESFYYSSWLLQTTDFCNTKLETSKHQT